MVKWFRTEIIIKIYFWVISGNFKVISGKFFIANLKTLLIGYSEVKFHNT